MKVNYTSNNGQIRIRVSQRGCKRLTWHPGLEYTNTNLKAAEGLCKRIELDILAGSFDVSFAKYALIQAGSIRQPKKEPTILEYWLEWSDFHRDKLSPTTYKCQLNTVTKFLSLYPLFLVTDSNKLISKSTEHYSKRTLQSCWRWLRTCFYWHIANGVSVENPFDPLPKGFKSLPKRSDVGVFTRPQQEVILKKFNEYSPNYVGFVAFLFATGCRPEEAIALTWNDIKDDYILINKAFVRGVLKETKTKKDRKIPLNERIKSILEKNCYSDTKLNSGIKLIFPNSLGGYINTSNFGTRIWKPLIEDLVLYKKLPEYLSLYHCRHTFISECLHAKIPIQQIARWVGNSPEMIWRHYAGVAEEYSLPE